MVSNFLVIETSQLKTLQRFATDSQLFGEELGNLLKKTKSRHSLQASKLSAEVSQSHK